jgi:hypothetical protein
MDFSLQSLLRVAGFVIDLSGVINGRKSMQMLMNVKFPLEPFNSAVRDGSVGDKMRKILSAIQPEVAYFTERDGHRGGVFVVEIKDPSEVPTFAEPFFLTFNAEVELRIAMKPEDLGRANLEALGEKWA